VSGGRQAAQYRVITVPITAPASTPGQTQVGPRYFRKRGTSVAIRTLLIRASTRGRLRRRSKELTTEIQQAEKSGAAPGEDRLEAAGQRHAQDERHQRLRVGVSSGSSPNYPKEGVLGSTCSAPAAKPNFSDRLALDTYRLSLAPAA